MHTEELYSLWGKEWIERQRASTQHTLEHDVRLIGFVCCGELGFRCYTCRIWLGPHTH